MWGVEEPLASAAVPEKGRAIVRSSRTLGEGCWRTTADDAIDARMREDARACVLVVAGATPTAAARGTTRRSMVCFALLVVQEERTGDEALQRTRPQLEEERLGDKAIGPRRLCLCDCDGACEA